MIPVKYQGRMEKIAQARDDGHRVIFGDDMTLQLDIDSPERLMEAQRLLAQFKTLLNIANVTMTRSKSNNWHLYVHLKKPIPKRERMLLQGVLGSDPVREILNWKYEPEHSSNECFFIEVTEEEVLVKI